MNSDPLVAKVGGGPIGSAPTLEDYKRVIEIFEDKAEGRPLVIIVSAFATMTDLFQKAYDNKDVSLIDRLKKRHMDISDQIFLDYDKTHGSEVAQVSPEMEKSRKAIAAIFEQPGRAEYALRKYLTPLGETGYQTTDHSKKVLAEILSTGERLSAHIAKTALELLGRPLTYIAATDFLMAIADESYTEAKPSYEKMSMLRGLYEDWTRASMRQDADKPHATKRGIITEGFIARSIEDGQICTLHREGSDESAVFIAKALAEHRSPRALLMKKLEGPRLESGSLNSLLVMQKNLGSHLVGESAVMAAMEHGVTIDICDSKTGEIFSYEPN